MGTTVPLSLFSVDATDLDDDVLTYSFTTTNVRQPSLLLQAIPQRKGLVSVVFYEGVA